MSPPTGNPPSAYVRWAGSKTGATVLVLAGLVLTGGVVDGALPWWAVLGALVAFSNAASCTKQIQGDNAWAGAWQEMATGERQAPPPRAEKRWRKNPKLDIAVGLLAVVALPWVHAQLDDAIEKRIIAWIWLAVCLGLLFLAVRGIVRRSRATARRQSVAPSDQVQPVAWLLAPAAASPSRADVVRELPEYSARLLGPG